jgi:dynein heavy chain
VLPLLQNAAETLEKITKDDMVQLRSFLAPPLSAASVMEGMCYVFNEDQNVKAKTIDGEKVQDFWEYSKKNILNDKLIKRVKEFKIDQVRAIPAIKIEKLKVFMLKPEFEKDRVFNASKAAGNLSLWIRAVVDTYEALLIVDPKKRLLTEAERQLLQSELLLRQKQDALSKVLAMLQELENNYEKARKEKEDL